MPEIGSEEPMAIPKAYLYTPSDGIKPLYTETTVTIILIEMNSSILFEDDVNCNGWQLFRPMEVIKRAKAIDVNSRRD